MTSEHLFDDKGKVRKKRQQEKKSEPQKKQNESDTTQGRLNAETVTHLQQTVGNAAVQRLLAQREGSGPAEVEEETAAQIQRERGQGQKLDENVADKAGKTMGHDFSDVTVHTDAQADTLSRKLGAKAFTTGKDVFFREGEYEPHSESGQKLLGHELTHVAQQSQNTPDVQGKLTVNDPNDQYETEADKVADKVVAQNQGDATSLQRQAPEEEEQLQMQAAPEEEEEIQMQAEEEEEIRMQAEEEEEIRMQAEEEEELQAG